MYKIILFPFVFFNFLRDYKAFIKSDKKKYVQMKILFLKLMENNVHTFIHVIKVLRKSFGFFVLILYLFIHLTIIIANEL
jgi:hypothetical protein